jgi:hypothetical protein
MVSTLPVNPTTQTLAMMRRMLVGVLLIGVSGMGIELIFIGHTDGVWQTVPLLLLGVGLAALGWLTVAPSVISVAIVQVVMCLFVLSGVTGVVLHYRGNEAFELEMYPDRAGFELVTQTLTGATPVLAPGSMSLLGLVGLVLTYTYPSGRR